jgi:hypothetical protein
VGGQRLFYDAKVVTVDAVERFGVVHIVDRVILPPVAAKTT